MREPFTHLRRPRKVPGDPRKGEFQGSASLAVEGVRFRQNLSGSLRMPASSETDTPPTQENDKPREGRDDPMRARILALEGVPVRRI
jgi:hypothetical protein